MISIDTRISPTADYTSYVWVRAGFSESVFATRRGYILYKLLEPMRTGSRLIGWTWLDDVLLARHRVIDGLLSKAIEAGRVGQVLEIAAGLSPRGRDFSARFADRGLIYVEGDLSHMAERKRELINCASRRPGFHHVVSLNAFSKNDLLSTCERYFDSSRGIAVVTEGLLPYVEPAKVHKMWHDFSDAVSRFPCGVYLSDLHIEDDTRNSPGMRAFFVGLSVFTRGRIYMHFHSTTEAESALREAGFERPSVHDASTLLDGTGFRIAPRAVRIVEAWR